MSLLRKILKITAVVVVLVVVLFLTFIGPWPVYKDSGYADAGYFKRDVETLTEQAAAEDLTKDPGFLRVGWSAVDMTPHIGVPLAGYGARKGEKRSTGVHDPLFTRAIAFSDGTDTVVLVGADMLIMPPNVAELVRARVAEKTGLGADSILFAASHTHCGPGGLAPAVAMVISAGPYDPEVPPFLADKISQVIEEAVADLAPGRLLHGGVDAPEFIRNRSFDDTPGRPDVVDPEVSYCLVEKGSGERCYLVSFSAHPTTYGANQMEFSAEFPGAMMRALTEKAKTSAVYLGGATGSMGPRTPDAPTEAERIELMGQGLAKKVLDDAAAREAAGDGWQDKMDVASVGLPLGMPGLQIRPLEDNTNWRLSPMVEHILGVPLDGWLSAARVGDMFFFGTPFDCSGEMSVRWKEWAAKKDLDLWVTGFNGAYLGYLSPDEYYDMTPLGYETGMMSWFGPDVSAQFTDLLEKSVEQLGEPAA
ncbi:MAG: hypothetical protein GC168_06970 [Candidatus Hydrogenedens sp.]|nr:hypothetical protein [Candidatus Hydrogenedens sp.]